jgi:hypothetical protein
VGSRGRGWHFINNFLTEWSKWLFSSFIFNYESWKTKNKVKTTQNLSYNSQPLMKVGRWPEFFVQHPVCKAEVSFLHSIQTWVLPSLDSRYWRHFPPGESGTKHLPPSCVLASGWRCTSNTPPYAFMACTLPTLPLPLQLISSTHIPLIVYAVVMIEMSVSDWKCTKLLRFEA